MQITQKKPKKPIWQHWKLRKKKQKNVATLQISQKKNKQINLATSEIKQKNVATLQISQKKINKPIWQHWKFNKKKTKKFGNTAN